MALTPEQIAAQLQDIGDNIPTSVGDAIAIAGVILENEIKSNPNFPVNTGALRDSLRIRVIDGQYMGISMLDYGFYQNY